jgi:hypothetical protein
MKYTYGGIELMNVLPRYLPSMNKKNFTIIWGYKKRPYEAHPTRGRFPATDVERLISMILSHHNPVPYKLMKIVLGHHWFIIINFKM